MGATPVPGPIINIGLDGWGVRWQGGEVVCGEFGQGREGEGRRVRVIMEWVRRQGKGGGPREQDERESPEVWHATGVDGA